ARGGSLRDSPGGRVGWSDFGMVCSRSAVDLARRGLPSGSLRCGECSTAVQLGAALLATTPTVGIPPRFEDRAARLAASVFDMARPPGSYPNGRAGSAGAPAA